MHLTQIMNNFLRQKIVKLALITASAYIFQLSPSYSQRPEFRNDDLSPDTLGGAKDSTPLEKSRSANIRYGLSAIASGTTGGQVPLWMRANLYGDVPLDGASLGFSGYFVRDYSVKKKKPLLDWGTGIDARTNLGKTAEVILIEAYVKGRLGIFQAKAGRSRDLTGLVDSTLSSGSFSISGNSLGIPKVEISIPEFYSIPFLWNIIAFKGNFAHGWLGDVDTRNGSILTTVKTYFHQKSLYAKFGRPNWKIKLLAGFNHQVFWGNEKRINGIKYKLSTLETYRRVVFGESYAGFDNGLPRSKVGNHLGSIDQGLEINTRNLKFFGYHQFFFEVGGLYHLNNVKDGLFGVSVANNKTPSSSLRFRWKKLLVEYIATKSQGGEIDAKITPSGDEDYYNNYIYDKGWSYKNENLGNPLLTSRPYARKGLPMESSDYFINNRLKAIQIGSECSIDKWDILVKLNYSLNYGTYGTSPWGHSLNNIRFPTKPPYFTEQSQFSGALVANRKLKQNMNVAFSLALDQGALLYNSTGLSVRLSKNW